MDTRTGDFPLSLFSERHDSLGSKYVRASVHPNGHLIAKGDMKMNAINIFDLRYANVDKTAPARIACHNSTILSAQFYECDSRQSIVSISKDNTILVSDYNY